MSKVNVVLDQNVPMNKIRQLSYNPEDRSDLDAKDIANLAQSIEQNGQYVPVVLFRSKDGKSFSLAEGNRRFTAMKLLERDTIMGLIYPHSHSANMANAWMVINDNVKKHTAQGKLFAWLQEPMTATTYMQSCYATMVVNIGRDMALKMVDNGYGYHMYKFYARNIWYFLSESISLREIVNWLIENKGMQAASRNWINLDRNSAILANAIRAGKPLTYMSEAA